MALARKTDKATSHKAAASVSRYAYQVVLEVAAKHPDRTANELAELCRAASMGTLAETFRKRTGELVQAEKLVETGVRKCTLTGKSATTYRVAKK